MFKSNCTTGYNTLNEATLLIITLVPGAIVALKADCGTGPVGPVAPCGPGSP
ncbi:TPA: hypothetical protein QCU53_004727 [Bacillus thuringiensis]|nr:hypothetical protein [Bacillus thuringiensis]